MYSIKEASTLTNLPEYTLRYYEKEHIIFSYRDTNGYRLYSQEAINWIKFIKILKFSKMPISDIKNYANLVLKGDSTLNERLDIIKNHKLFIEQSIKELININNSLEYKINNYNDLISKYGKQYFNNEKSIF